MQTINTNLNVLFFLTEINKIIQTYPCVIIVINYKYLTINIWD